MRQGFPRRFPKGLAAGIAATFAAAIAAVVGIGAAQAQSYPAKPIRLVVPYTPGAGTDTIARILAQKAGESLGQQVVVDNRPGAGGTIGTEIVAKSQPDGYTLLLGSQTNAISATLNAKLPYDPIDDFARISLIGREPGVLVVNPAPRAINAGAALICYHAV